MNICWQQWLKAFFQTRLFSWFPEGQLWAIVLGNMGYLEKKPEKNINYSIAVSLYHFIRSELTIMTVLVVREPQNCSPTMLKRSNQRLYIVWLTQQLEFLLLCMLLFMIDFVLPHAIQISHTYPCSNIIFNSSNNHIACSREEWSKQETWTQGSWWLTRRMSTWPGLNVDFHHVTYLVGAKHMVVPTMKTNENTIKRILSIVIATMRHSSSKERPPPFVSSSVRQHPYRCRMWRM